MDAMTYVVLAGWVLMYFVPSFMLATGIAGVMALVAGYIVFLQNAAGGADPVQTLLTVGPIAFVGVFMAWPLGAGMRWVKRRFKGAGI